MEKLVQSIKTSKEINPSIYAYTTPGYKPNDGWIKIGYTERDVDTRIKEQTHTASIRAEILWKHYARFNEGKYFKDTDFHSYLSRHDIERRTGTEWFFFDDKPERSEQMFMNFAFHKDSDNKSLGDNTEYILRKEQEEAVNKALEYFKENNGGEFLWNAKPRFGKTLSAYDLAIKLEAKNVLIVTNRPAIANSWYDDYKKFIAWKTDYLFISTTSSLRGDEKDVWTREEYLDERANGNRKALNISFISLQDLKGSKYMGGNIDKLRWVTGLKWDLLIIDEAHEGVDTLKTDLVFDNIERKYTLHLSGTPFKQIAGGKFSEDQIYNWSYVDEQEAKKNWQKDSYNPYSDLPKLNMFTYQMSTMIIDKLEGAGLGEENNIDFAFDLNEFFSTNEKGGFVYEDAVRKWLDTLTSNEKYPFSTHELRNELKHTFWFLDRVASANALKDLLEKHPVFENYKIVLAAGPKIYDGEKNMEAFARVRKAIEENDKTITLSVGQLTTGVTVPEWSAVMMLNNVKSPALYMQAAFRSQNAHSWDGLDSRGRQTRYQKNNAYIFDFAPERTLIIVDEFANNLNPSTSSGAGTSDRRKENIKTLLNFFPVIGEDNQGRMVELNVNQVMTIPKNIKAREVVRRGFMSNLLFADLTGIFRSPSYVIDIINNFNKTEEGKAVDKKAPLKGEDFNDIDLDDEGEVIVDNNIVINKSAYIFGEKEYEKILEPVKEDDYSTDSKKFAKKLIDTYDKSGSFDKLKEEYGLSDNTIKKEKKDFEKKLVDLAERYNSDIKISSAHHEDDLSKELEKAQSDLEKEELISKYEKKKNEELDKQFEEFKARVYEEEINFSKETIEKHERQKKEKEKISIEDDIRARLRGFARTIPSFIMAYGDENLKLSNIDEYTPDDVFKDVTGITIEEFKFLRDGGTYFDEEKEEEAYFKGKVFDEIVFNQSIQEFLAKRKELENYFEDKGEDIFDYIPNQKTNQIFTPKWVVKMMVDQLEEENPGIYDDSSKTFIDLYMKSGLYITELVKRLYNSEVIKKEIPDGLARKKHILENQVFGLAPTEIIYRIAIRFIFGEGDEQISQRNFKMLDSYPYAEDGSLKEKLDEVFGEDR